MPVRIDNVPILFTDGRKHGHNDAWLPNALIQFSSSYIPIRCERSRGSVEVGLAKVSRKDWGVEATMVIYDEMVSGLEMYFPCFCGSLLSDRLANGMIEAARLDHIELEPSHTDPKMANLANFRWHRIDIRDLA